MQSDKKIGSKDLGGVVFKEKGFNRYNALGIVNSTMNLIPGVSRSDEFRGAALVQNFTCFKYLQDSRNRRVPRECTYPLLNRDLSRERGKQRLLNKQSENFKRDFAFVKDEYSTFDKFIRWDVFVDSSGNGLTFSPKIGCFHRLNEWLDLDGEKNFQYVLEFKVYKISPYLQLDGTIEHEMKTGMIDSYVLSFNPKRVHRRRAGE